MKKERTPRDGEEKNSKGWRRKELQGMKEERTSWNGKGVDSRNVEENDSKKWRGKGLQYKGKSYKCWVEYCCGKKVE